MAGGLVEVSLEQRPHFAFLVHSSTSGWDFDFDEDMVRSVDGLRQRLTTCTQVVVKTVAVYDIHG